MANPIGVFSSLVAWCKLQQICTDNGIFRLHYRVTTMILLAFFVVITTTQFVGDPMKCAGNGNNADDIWKKIIDNYCWIHGTHTIQDFFTGQVGKDIAHPGIGSGGRRLKVVSHPYYQWITFLLPLQAALFYAPHIIWKMFEKHKIKGLTNNLDGPLLPETWTLEVRENLARYLINISLYTNNLYAYQFAFCELLNFINTVGQIFLTDLFFGGNFVSYGIMFWKYQRGDWDPNMASPMDMIFPKVSTCHFYYFGPTATLQSREYMCVLNLNVIHEKVFLFLWFWFVILSIISGIALVYRIFVFTCPCVRAYSIIVQAKLVPKYYIYSIVSKFTVSDWFMLNQIGKNMNVFAFKDLVTLLGEELDKMHKVEQV